MQGKHSVTEPHISLPFVFINIHPLQGHSKCVCLCHAEIVQIKKVGITKMFKISAIESLKLSIEQKYFSIESFEVSTLPPSDPNHINEGSILFQGCSLLVL